MKATAFCDGRGNAGINGSCASVIYLFSGNCVETATKLGEVTNNVAEYRGVILSLQTALEHNVTDIDIHSDSQVIVNQLRGVYEARNETLFLLRNEAWKLAESFKRVNIVWIPRELNKRSDYLCRKIAKSAEDSDLFSIFQTPFIASSAVTT